MHLIKLLKCAVVALVFPLLTSCLGARIDQSSGFEGVGVGPTMANPGVSPGSNSGVATAIPLTTAAASEVSDLFPETLTGYPQHVAITALDEIYFITNEFDFSAGIDNMNYSFIYKIDRNGVRTVVLDTRKHKPLLGGARQWKGLAVDTAHNLYTSDWGKIMKIDATGRMTTFYSSGKDESFEVGAVDEAGTIYVTESGKHYVAKITAGGIFSTLAHESSFNQPGGIAVDGAGNVFVADSRNHRVCKVTPTGTVTTLAGGTKGHRDGVGHVAQFDGPWDLELDASGNLIVTEFWGRYVRKVSMTGEVTTVAGSTPGYKNGSRSEAQFVEPMGIGVSKNGPILIADGKRLRRVTP